MRTAAGRPRIAVRARNSAAAGATGGGHGGTPAAAARAGYRRLPSATSCSRSTRGQIAGGGRALEDLAALLGIDPRLELQDRLADAPVAAGVVPGEIEMEMIVVEGVGARARAPW